MAMAAGHCPLKPQKLVFCSAVSSSRAAAGSRLRRQRAGLAWRWRSTQEELDLDVWSISCFGSLLSQHWTPICGSCCNTEFLSRKAAKIIRSYFGAVQVYKACLREQAARYVKSAAQRRSSQGATLKNLYKHSQPNNCAVATVNDPSSLIKMYSDLLTDGRLKDCVELLESMDRKGILKMDSIHHTSFLNACKNHKAVNEAFRFCKLIRDPQMSTFNALLSVCAASKDFNGAFHVMLLLKQFGLKPDCKLYTTLISTCAKCGKVDAMFEVFHEMVNAGIEPNVNTYGALIDGCAKAGQVAKAFGAYGIMRSKKVQPDRVIFNSLITACGETGAVRRAFDVLAEMTAEPRPILPDHVTIGALLKTCTQAGQIDQAHMVYNMIKEYNIKGSTEVFTSAVRVCSLNGDMEFALKIYDDMEKSGVKPDEMFLSALVDVAGHAGKIDTSFEIIKEAKRKGVRVGNIVYSSLMGACCNGKDWKKALELYEEIKSTKLTPTVSAMNALITSLCDGDQLTTSVEVFDWMKQSEVQPNEITYSVLIVACEKRGEAELAFQIYEQAKEDGICINHTFCGCLTGLCLQSFENDYSLGNVVVKFDTGKPHIDNKWTTLAIKVYREAISANIAPTADVISQVLGCLRFPRDSSVKHMLVENLGIHSDVSKYPNVHSLLEGFGAYDPRSFSILEEVANRGLVPSMPLKEVPIVVDTRKLQIYTAEVYLLTTIKGLKHRLAAGARLPGITVLLSTEKTRVESPKGGRTVHLAGRVGQAIASLLRRLGISYQGDESHGKIRITGLTMRRWFKSRYAVFSSVGRPTDMLPLQTRLAKGIADQQRSIRSGKNLTLEI